MYQLVHVYAIYSLLEFFLCMFLNIYICVFIKYSFEEQYRVVERKGNSKSRKFVLTYTS